MMSQQRRSSQPPSGTSTPLHHEPGKSLFPISRIQKIIRVDKELPIVAKEAVMLISIATEEFIKRLSEASQKQAEREKRSTVQRRDVAAVVRRADEFIFLDEIIPWVEEDVASRPRKKTGVSLVYEKAVGPMEKFVSGVRKVDVGGEDVESLKDIETTL